jgi:hypothetical protein
MTSTSEEVECFRQPNGGFSPEKRYEYTYSTRRSFEYIPALCREDFRYFTTKPYIYAGVWLRSEQRGFGDGGDYWEVFRNDDDDDDDDDDDGTEKIVSWDYNGTLCWRECATADAATADAATADAVVAEILDEILDETIESVSKTTHHIDEPAPAPPPPPTAQWSLFECIFGQSSKCGLFDKAEITTMEAKHCVHPNIAEFWCFITSFFYGSSLLLYYVKEEDWFEKWCEEAALPGYIHLSIWGSVVVMICSLIYHSTLFELTGCIDCFFASFVFASVTMSTFGVRLESQLILLALFGIAYIMMWRYSTRIALIGVCLVFPFTIFACYHCKSYYGLVIGILISAGAVCFLLDRLGYAPFHSLWHILSSLAMFMSLYHVIVYGPVLASSIIPLPLSSDYCAFSLVR